MNGSSTANVVGKKRCPATPWANEVEGIIVMIVSKTETEIDHIHISVEFFVLRFTVTPFFNYSHTEQSRVNAYWIASNNREMFSKRGFGEKTIHDPF